MTERKRTPGELSCDTRIAALQAEIAALRSENGRLVGYVRAKTNELLKVMGTIPLRPEELDDATLIEFDPIGIVAESFTQVLANLRRTNQKLHVAHQEIQAVFDSVGAAVLVLDPQRNIIAYNDRIRKSLFAGDGDFTGKYCRDVICNNAVPEQHCVHSRVLASGQTEAFPGWEFNEHCFDVIGQPIRNDAGDLTHIVLAYSDVTEYRRNARALQQALAEVHAAKSQVDGLLKSMADGLIASDAAGHVVLMNPAAERILGTTLAQSLGKPLQAITFIPKLQEYFRERLHGEIEANCDFELRFKAGQVRTYRARSSRIADAGAPGGRITFLHDISRESEVERMKDEFLSTAAHQLRTPLAAIIGFSELIMDSQSLGDEERSEYIGLIYSKAEQLSEIVSNLLDISRIEAGNGPSIVPEPLMSGALVEEALAGFRKSGHAHDFDVAVEPVPLVVDRFAMLQVLENLVSNAIKYSAEGSRIRLSGQVEEGGGYRLAVSDQGVGMTPEQAAQVFNKFYRADASNTAISGTGLGLTIVRYLVEAHGGTVRIDTRPGRGTTVNVILPPVA